MPYFPLFVSLENQKVLIIGGGAVALRKAGKLSHYGPDMTVIAPDVLPEFEQIENVKIERRTFSEHDLEGAALVIAATDQTDVNRRAALLCRELKIPVDAADNRELCTFVFPSLVQKGELSIGIMTGGASPSASAMLRERIEEMIPERFDEILEFLREKRKIEKVLTSDGIVRERLSKALFAECLKMGRKLTDDEYSVLVNKMKGDQV